MIINPKNKNRIDSSILKKIKRGSRVLACGVGDGSEVQYLRLKKINAYGIDPSRIKKNQIKSRLRLKLIFVIIENLKL